MDRKSDSEKKVINYMLNGKDTIIHSIVGLMKKMLNEILWYKNESIFS